MSIDKIDNNEISTVCGGWCLCESVGGRAYNFIPVFCTSEAECKSLCCDEKKSKYWGWSESAVLSLNFRACEFNFYLL